MQVDGPTRRMSRLKRTWMKVVRQALQKSNLYEDLALDRSEWINRISVTDINVVGTMLCR